MSSSSSSSRSSASARTPLLLQQTLAQAREQDEARVAELETEQRTLERDQAHWHAEMRKLAVRLVPDDADDPVISRLADL